MASYCFVIEGCWTHRAGYIVRNLLIPPLLVLGTVAERVSFYDLSVSLPKPWGYSKQADVTPTVAFFTRNTTRAIFLPHTTHPYRHLRHPAPYRHVLCNFSTREVLNSRQISYCQYGLVCVVCGSHWLRLHSASCFYHHVLYSGTTKRSLKGELQKKKRSAWDVKEGKRKSEREEKTQLLCSMEFGNDFQPSFGLYVDVHSLTRVRWGLEILCHKALCIRLHVH